MLNRLEDYYCGDIFVVYGLPPYHLSVYIISLVSSLIIISLSLILVTQDTIESSLLDFQAAALSFTMASPIAWEHHYGVLLPIYVALYMIITSHSNGRERHYYALYVLGLSYILTATFVPIYKLFSGSVFDLLDSYLLLGAIILLGCINLTRKNSSAKGAQVLFKKYLHRNF